MSFARIPSLTALCGAVLLAAACSHHNMHETRGVKVGVLTCKNIPDSNFSLLIHSTTDVECTIEHSGIEDKYKGEAGVALGVDLNWNRNETLRYTVFATHGADEPRGFLAGRFTGVKAGASLGMGGGLQVLVGGGKEHITLQPLVLETTTGMSVHGGLGYLYLEPA
jgi:hypothetical protein